VYKYDTEIAYPTAKHYEAGVYHHEAQTVTITKGGQAYTCEYEQTKKYEATSTPKKGREYLAHATSAPVHVSGYGHNKPSATPNEYPAYPGNSKPSSSVHEVYSAVTLSAAYSKPSYHGGHGYGGEAKSTSVAASSKPYKAVKSTPVYGDSTKGYAHPTSAPVYDHSAMSTSTSCTNSKTPSPTPEKSAVYSAEVPSIIATSTSCTDSKTLLATPTKSSAYNTKVYGHPTSTPVAPSTFSAPAYGQSTPIAAASTPCSTNTYGNLTSTPVAPANPDPSSDYEEPAESYGKAETSYTKRGGLIQRRKIVAAKAKRTILL
jgi:hypothetical protein